MTWKRQVKENIDKIRLKMKMPLTEQSNGVYQLSRNVR